MRFRGTLHRLFRSSRNTTQRRGLRARLFVEELAPRFLPASIAPIADANTPTDKTFLAPLSIVSPSGDPVTFSVVSDNASVTATVLPGNNTDRHSLDLEVSGTDNTDTPFTGHLILQLFESEAPLATARIIALATGGSYNGSNFHRVIDGFVAQGGDVNTALGIFDDEYNTDLTFNSEGLFALANAGDDDNQTQFFITDIGLTLDQMNASGLTNLSFNHTIFGQLTSGFDIFQKIMTADVTGSTPVHTITINSATIFTDQTDAVLKVTATPNFHGSANLTISAADGGPAIANTQFKVTFVADTVNDRPFLGTIGVNNVITTTIGTGVTFDIPATDLEDDGLTYVVKGQDALIGSGPRRNRTVFQNLPGNVTANINQADGRVTLTPAPNFVGSIKLVVGVRDDTPRNGFALDDRRQFDTQEITLTVTGDIDLNAASDTGTLNDDNVTGDPIPSFTINAPSGSVVKIQVNGGSPITATQTSAGRFSVTLPDNLLNVGANTITGTVTVGSNTPTNLTPVTITYAPSLADIYVVRGDRGTSQTVNFVYDSREARFNNEIGVFKVDDLGGTINGIAPGAAGYAQAAAARYQTLFTGDQGGGGASKSLSFNGGDILAFCIIQDSSSAAHQAQNPDNELNGTPLAFFSLTAANPDSIVHVHAVDDPLRSEVRYAWEDRTGGGDRDYNDVVFSVSTAGGTTGEAVRIAAATGRDVSVKFELETAKKSANNADQTPTTTATGEVGFFTVDDATGKIGSLNPGSAGWLAAALDPSRRKQIFATNDNVGASVNLFLQGGAFLGFYFIPGGTSDGLLSTNPTNTASGTPLAYFSFRGANPDSGVVHFRSFGPELVSQTIPTSTDPFRFHFMGILNGTATDFDDVVFSMQQNP
jgi:cyclophilin family peptidyl-prolyl cis-trans isomerase